MKKRILILIFKFCFLLSWLLGFEDISQYHFLLYFLHFQSRIEVRCSNCDDNKNNKLLLKELKNIPLDGRTARYQCVIVYMPFYDHPLPKIYNGTWEGYIGFEEKGENGFGYDPLFFLPDFECTAAQLSEEQKNKISHRGKALSLFKKDFLE